MMAGGPPRARVGRTSSTHHHQQQQQQPQNDSITTGSSTSPVYKCDGQKCVLVESKIHSPKGPCASCTMRSSWMPVSVLGVFSLFSLVLVANHWALPPVSLQHQPHNLLRPKTSSTTNNSHKHVAPKATGAAAATSYSSTISKTPFLPKPYPPFTNPDSSILYSTWDKWAAKPDTGSFVYHHDPSLSSLLSQQQQQQQKQQQHDFVLHLPFADLDTIYSTAQSMEELKAFTKSSYPSSECILLTRKGNKLPFTGVGANQDRIGVIHKKNRKGNDGNDGNEDEDEDDESQADWWMGLLDGHGPYGHAVAQMGLYELGRTFVEYSQTRQNGEDEASTDSIQQHMHSVYASLNQQIPDLNSSGSTAISIMKLGTQLIISTLGDSIALVVGFHPSNPDEVQIVYQSQPHKPDVPEERQRIEAAGGQVQLPPEPGYSARFVYPLPFSKDAGRAPAPEVDDDDVTPNDNPLLMRHYQPQQPIMAALAMSRCLGDLDGIPYGLSAEPRTTVLDLSMAPFSRDQTYFVVVATDGLMDVLPILGVAQGIARTEWMKTKSNNNGIDNKDDNDNNNSAPMELAEVAIRQASHIWTADGTGYRDDISLAIHKLHW